MARKRVAELKGFYVHATVYILVNLFLTIASVSTLITNGKSLSQISYFELFLTPFFWGIGLAFHAAKVFGYNPFFGKDWETRQIKKFMEEDRKVEERFNHR